MSDSGVHGNVVRRPRHEVNGTGVCEVWVETTVGGRPFVCDAQLADVSRQGFQITLDRPLPEEDDLVLRITDPSHKLDLALPAHVRWQRVDSDDRWHVGCMFADMVSYEVLGELFLCGILKADIDDK